MSPGSLPRETQEAPDRSVDFKRVKLLMSSSAISRTIERPVPKASTRALGGDQSKVDLGRLRFDANSPRFSTVRKIVFFVSFACTMRCGGVTLVETRVWDATPTTGRRSGRRQESAGNEAVRECFDTRREGRPTGAVRLNEGSGVRGAEGCRAGRWSLSRARRGQRENAQDGRYGRGGEGDGGRGRRGRFRGPWRCDPAALPGAG